MFVDDPRFSANDQGLTTNDGCFGDPFLVH